MTRQDFLLAVEQIIKPAFNGASVMEYYAPEVEEWLSLSLYPQYFNTESEVIFTYYIKDVRKEISEKSFDKYYLGATKKARELFGISYNCKAEVEYTEKDIKPAVDTLHYSIIKDIEKYFFPKDIDN